LCRLDRPRRQPAARFLPASATIGHDPRVTTLLVPTSEGVPLRLDLAGAGSRIVAGLLDAAILLTGYLVVLVSILVPVSFDPTGVSGFLLGILVGGAVLAVLAYHVVFHALFAGQTPGKRVLGIRVASADGHPATLLQLVLRALLMPIDGLVMVPVPLGILAIAVTGRHQRFGDVVAGTLLVRLPDLSARAEPYPEASWSGLPAKVLPLTPGTAAHLTPEDREILRQLLTRTELTDRSRRALFISAARIYGARLGLGALGDARDVLRELYLYAREAAARPAA
jgi:uncharacterized RDD family membrane protein YckC